MPWHQFEGLFRHKKPFDEQEQRLRRVLVFGNSGSGKSTLARSLNATEGLTHFDLDCIAWLDADPPERSPLLQCAKQINDFVSQHEGWVIEGCYADLLAMATPRATEMIFLNLSVDACIANAKARPWEPEKYPTQAAQDANLEMLIDWIQSYPSREDPCSQAAHQGLYDSFTGLKSMRTTSQ